MFGLPSARLVPNESLQRLELEATGPGVDGVVLTPDGIVFERCGWYEVLLTVEWDPDNTSGHRFAHTAIPDRHPLHSEAIEASVLSRISHGRQLLRGNTLFGLDSTDAINLEVWQDSGGEVTVAHAALEIRRLDERR